MARPWTSGSDFAKHFAKIFGFVPEPAFAKPAAQQALALPVYQLNRTPPETALES